VIIAIDTASTDVSIALADRDGALIHSDGWSAGPRQSHELLPRIMTVLDSRAVALDAVSALAVGIGPGSFTGLRVGMSIAKGLAFALGRPIVGVPSLEAWLDAEPDAGGAAVRAGAREAYVLERGGPGPQVVDRDELATFAARLVAPVELTEAFGLGATLQPFGAAVAIAASAARRLERAPDGDDLERLEPAYLRAPRGVAQSAAEVR
jgi:tRNA threonylcarbamoyl adenosine modification protein YeaZ